MSEKFMEVVSRADGEKESKYTPEELETTILEAKKILLSEGDGAVIVIQKTEEEDGMGYIKINNMSPAEVVLHVAYSLEVSPLSLIKIASLMVRDSNAKTTEPKTTEEAQKEGAESAEGPKE